MNGRPIERLPGSPGCFICDNNGSNRRSLGLKLLWDEQSRTVRIPCEPDDSWCGFSNVVHGGLIATVMDEAMAWAVKMHTGDWAFTADCHIRYKRPAEPGERYLATAAVRESGKRKITAQARFLDQDGQVLAEASAIFLPAKGKARPRTA